MKTSLEVRTLASGSKGNSIFIRRSGRAILVDAGISMKRIAASLNGLDCELDNIEAIFVTHEHSDHVKGLGMIAKHAKTPIYLSYESAREIYISLTQSRSKDEADAFRSCARIIEPGKCYDALGLNAEAFSIPHDSVRCLGFKFTDDDGSALLGIATDVGHLDENVCTCLAGCENVIVESNHDPEMLRNSSYPPALIERIASPYGHLSNPDCGSLCAGLVRTGTKRMTLFHLSDENNLPSLARDTVLEALKKTGAKETEDFFLNTAQRDEITEVCG
ncbi:MAG: MBL fold metallo-hydrolase [Clostridia bacterium]|nr:MBL fold metallo-hydrolase [Clostridia bacterium]